MIITNFHARILHLGEVKEVNKFKKCYALIETKGKKDEFGDDVYKPEQFEVEVALKDDKTYPELQALAPINVTSGSQSGIMYTAGEGYFPATFNLRSFTYKEKGIDKLGKQLQLKRWTR